jgi:hypothetical protein
MSNNVQIPTTVGSPTTTIEAISESGGVYRQVIVLGSIGDASGETQLSAGQKTSANSIPIVIASDQSTITALPGQTGTDGSTSITTGGTAQNLFGGVTPTNGFEICNPDPSEDLWISDSTTAALNGQGSYRVAPAGSTYTTPAGYKPIGAVSAIASTTGHKITARRW